MLNTRIENFMKASLIACKEVQELLVQPRTADDFDILEIGEGGDPSIVIDVKAEAIFFKHFLPHFAVYSEEYGTNGNSEFLIILDPIDGSDNFVSAFPYYGASMALQYKGVTIAALVCNLVNGDVFTRIKDQPAFWGNLWDESKKNLLIPNRHAKVGIFEKSSLYTDIVDKLIKDKLKFRSPGAVALSLVYAYSARYMIFIGKERAFDIAGGLFIAESLLIHRENEVIIIAHEKQILQKLKAIVLGE